jgi:hypothetical protein
MSLSFDFLIHCSFSSSLSYFFPRSLFRSRLHACFLLSRCLASLRQSPYRYHRSVSKFLTPDVNVAQVYKTGNPQVQEFIRYLSLFITTFLKNHLGSLEAGTLNTQPYNILSLISTVSILAPISFFILLARSRWSASALGMALLRIHSDFPLISL